MRTTKHALKAPQANHASALFWLKPAYAIHGLRRGATVQYGAEADELRMIVSQPSSADRAFFQPEACGLRREGYRARVSIGRISISARPSVRGNMFPGDEEAISHQSMATVRTKPFTSAFSQSVRHENACIQHPVLPEEQRESRLLPLLPPEFTRRNAALIPCPRAHQI